MQGDPFVRVCTYHFCQRQHKRETYISLDGGLNSCVSRRASRRDTPLVPRFTVSERFPGASCYTISYAPFSFKRAWSPSSLLFLFKAYPRGAARSGVLVDSEKTKQLSQEEWSEKTNSLLAAVIRLI